VPGEPKVSTRVKLSIVRPARRVAARGFGFTIKQRLIDAKVMGIAVHQGYRAAKCDCLGFEHVEKISEAGRFVGRRATRRLRILRSGQRSSKLRLAWVKIKIALYLFCFARSKACFNHARLAVLRSAYSLSISGVRPKLLLLPGI
jgi:hypothetical protein